ncbi:MAG: alpha-amylase family glycosyl hydrolase [Bacillaceae bacterium]
MGKNILALLLVPFLLFSCLPVQAAEKEERTWQDEIIYYLMIDRFNNGDTSNDYDVNPNDPYGYHGGDLKGIISKLDYIKDFGFTTIWITPVVSNEEKGYHGYWTKDFYKVDKHFGTMEDMKKLVKAAHKRGLKVIVDQEVNHVGATNPWLKDEAKRDWFHEQKEIENSNNQTELEKAWLMSLPDLNTENEEVQTYLFDMVKWWITETNIDGMRLNSVKYIPKDFWTKLTKEVKSIKKDFFLIGDVSFDDEKAIASYESTGIESFLNFPYYNAITDAFVKPNTSAGNLYNVWKKDQQYFQNPYVLGNFIDNEDVVRFSRQAKLAGEYPPSRLKLALAYLYSSPGIPIVYYGTEIALDGGETPDNRRLMDFKTDENFSKYVKKLAEIRKQLPALRYGDFEMLIDKQGLSVFKRTYEGKSAVIIINNTTKDQTIHLTNEQLAENKELRGLLEDDIIRSTKDGYDVFVQREKANIYSLNERTGINKGFVAAVIAVYCSFMVFLFLLWKRGKKKVS